MKNQVYHNLLWGIIGKSMGQPGSATALWDWAAVSATYRRYYPKQAEAMEDPTYVPDIDGVIRNFHNMVIEEIILTGNFDQRDARSAVPLTKDEVVTEIKKAAAAPDSLVSLLTSGVAKIQLIADQFVSGARPLEKSTVEKLRVDYRASPSDPVDSDPRALLPRTSKVMDKSEREEELKRFVAKMEKNLQK